MKEETHKDWMNLVETLRMENRRDFTISLDDFEKILFYVQTRARHRRVLKVKYIESDCPLEKETKLPLLVDQGYVRKWDRFFNEDGEFKIR